MLYDIHEQNIMLIWIILVFSEYREAFNLFDRDKSGEISIRELEIAMRSLGQNPSEEELKRLIAEVDKDGKKQRGPSDLEVILRELYA